MSAPPFPYAPPFRSGGGPPPYGSMGPAPGSGFPPGRPPHMGGHMGGAPPPMPYSGMGPPRGPPRPYGPRGLMMPLTSRNAPPGGAAPVVLPKPRPAVDKSTTVYVGKIASTVEDELIRSLLEACGEIKSWKRQEDPETKQLKGFGFCEFEDAEGVLRAIRLLNNVKLDGQELLLKGNTATQKYIEDYEATKEQKKREPKAKVDKEKDKDKEQGELNEEVDEGDVDNAVLEKIMSIVTDREEQQRAKQSDSQRANDFLKKLESKEDDVPLPPPPRREHSSISDRRDSRLSSDRDARFSNERESRYMSERDGRFMGERERDSRDSRLNMERDTRVSSERDLERQYEQRREDQRKKDESRHRELEREYDRLLKMWEQRERDYIKNRDKEKEYLREMERDRARQIKADIEASDSEDELEPWMRRSYRSSRRAEERRKRRYLEEREDDMDRKLEEREEAERAKRRREEESSHQVQAEDNGDAHESGQPVKLEPEVKVEVKEEDADIEAEPHDPSPAEPQIDPNDPIYQAMIAAAKAAPTKPRSPLQPPSQPAASATPIQERRPAVSPPGQASHISATSTPAVAQKTKGKGVNILAMFGDDDEQENKRRKLVPLQYTEEEIKAVSQPAAAPEDPQTLLKKMMDTIPTKKDDVFAYKIKWDAYDVGTMGPRVSNWVSKKVAEFLGMDEPTLVTFIMQLLSKRKSAGDLMVELESILDSDAEMFVLKLFRMLIYETEKAALGL